MEKIVMVTMTSQKEARLPVEAQVAFLLPIIQEALRMWEEQEVDRTLRREPALPEETTLDKHLPEVVLRMTLHDRKEVRDLEAIQPEAPETAIDPRHSTQTHKGLLQAELPVDLPTETMVQRLEARRRVQRLAVGFLEEEVILREEVLTPDPTMTRLVHHDSTILDPLHLPVRVLVEVLQQQALALNVSRKVLEDPAEVTHLQRELVRPEAGFQAQVMTSEVQHRIGEMLLLVRGLTTLEEVRNLLHQTEEELEVLQMRHQPLQDQAQEQEVALETEETRILPDLPFHLVEAAKEQVIGSDPTKDNLLETNQDLNYHHLDHLTDSDLQRLDRVILDRSNLEEAMAEVEEQRVMLLRRHQAQDSPDNGEILRPLLQQKILSL